MNGPTSRNSAKKVEFNLVTYCKPMCVSSLAHIENLPCLEFNQLIFHIGADFLDFRLQFAFNRPISIFNLSATIHDSCLGLPNVDSQFLTVV